LASILLSFILRHFVHLRVTPFRILRIEQWLDGLQLVRAALVPEVDRQAALVAALDVVEPENGNVQDFA
jgi:hypothetical protein